MSVKKGRVGDLSNNIEESMGDNHVWRECEAESCLWKKVGNLSNNIVESVVGGVMSMKKGRELA